MAEAVVARDAQRWCAPERSPAHFEHVFRAAYALSGSREAAEDLVRETYARALRRPRRLRWGSEPAYLMRVLRVVWYDAVKTGRDVPSADPRDAPEQVEFASDGRADSDVVLESRAAYAVIAGLSTPLRETIVAVDVLGLSYKQAARALRVRQATIQRRLYTARRSVAQAMEGARR